MIKDFLINKMGVWIPEKNSLSSYLKILNGLFPFMDKIQPFLYYSSADINKKPR